MISKNRNVPILLMRIVLLSAFCFQLVLPAVSFSDITFQNTPLKEVIQQIQNRTPYFFLYRESQIAGIRITLESTDDKIINDLRSILTGYQIDLTVDHARYQVLLTRTQEAPLPPRSVQIKGHVVDAETGERLPFASVMWQINDSVRGVAANSSGYFLIQTTTDQPRLTLSVSYVGYNSREISIELYESNRVEDLTVRLEPKMLRLNEIVVSEFIGSHPSDTLLTGLLDARRFSPLGESNSIRALQGHPSVSAGTALNNGINVRGSTPDGFLVLLDGMTIFNQSHLFGLLDSFNADAIQTAGYYFNVPPANIDSPTGGTLNMITRTGSRNEFRYSVGMSNTSINGTFEGPLGEHSSWLLSARGSYMDIASWFNNSDLIQWGLDINRPKRIASDEPDFTDLVLRPGSASARFIDVHSKFYIETVNAGRFIFSGYFGGDRTSQDAQRRVRSTDADRQFTFEDVKTSNRWGNALISITYEDEIADGIYSSIMAGFSSYETDFEKDDFVYSRVHYVNGTESITVFTYPFRNRSTMNEFKINQDIEYRRDRFSATGGAGWKYLIGSYSELSFDHSGFFSETNAHIAYTYLQSTWNPLHSFEMNVGGRLYYYHLDKRFRAAPRVQIRVTPTPSLTLSAGYSINHQFLHRISLANATTTDVWILSTRIEPPATSTQISAGIQYIPDPLFIFQLNGYVKDYDNLRMHELETQSLAGTFAGKPWFYQNKGTARGVELLVKNRWRRCTLTQSYTLSQMTFTNPFFFDGKEYFADWDRTHSYNAVLEIQLADNLQIYLSGIAMSGAPNALAMFGVDTVDRLDAYYRFDTTISYQTQFSGSSNLEISLSIFNLLNRDNVWYRNYAFNFDETRSIPRLIPVPVDVLDLGFHPSFKVQYTF